jgi:hypothetical protein
MHDGGQFEQDSLPGSISGTGFDGARVTLAVDGTPAGTTTVEGGRWSLPFPARLAPGAHGLSASQSVDGVTSEPMLATFTINAPVAPGPAEPAGPAAPAGPADPAAPAEPAGPPPADVLPAGTPGQLANTGAGPILPTALLAGGSLLLGTALLVLGRRSRSTAAPQA